MLPKEQLESIKKQLIKEIENNFPEDKKQELIDQIKDMNSDELESFLKQNKLIREDSKCIFCSIIESEIPSYKIDENEDAVAVLEINPASKAHILIIPKIHSKEISNKTIELAKKIAETIKIFTPKKIDIIPSSLFGHDILNILPVYENETLESPKTKLKEKELKSLQEKIKKSMIKTKQTPEEKPQREASKEEIISEKNTWLPRRIP